MPKVRGTRKHAPRPGSIHARAGCHLSVHGPQKGSHQDAGSKYVMHGPNPFSKLIASLSVRKRKTKTKQVLSKRKGPTVFVDIINETLAPTPPATVRRSGCKRKIPRRFVQEGSGKISSHMRNIEQVCLIHQRRNGNPWMVNGYAARL